MKLFTVPRLALAIAIAVIVGCSGGGTNGMGELPDPVAKAINASTDSAAMDFQLNETQIGNNLAYLQSAPGFIPVEPGDYDVVAVEEGRPDSQTIVAATLVTNTSYVVVSAGLLDPDPADLEKRLRTTIIEVDRTAPNGNKARLVIFHAYNRAAGLQTPHLDFQNPGDTPQFKVENIEFAGGSIRDIDSGSQTFVARRTESEDEVTPQITFNFLPGKIYIAIISGTEGDAVHQPAINIIEI